MLYDIYFHNDFDGRASAAVMLAFLRSRGDDIGHYVPIRYDVIPQWLDENYLQKHKLFKGKHNLAIIVDFPFHPGTKFWFDHHVRPFRKDGWEKKFKPDRFRRYDDSYASATHLVYDSLKRDFGWKPPAHLKELVKWLDVIDGANYKSAKQTIEMKEPAIQLNNFIEENSDNLAITMRIIKLLSQKSITAIARDPGVKKNVEKLHQSTKTALDFYKKNMKIVGGVMIVDLSGFPFAELGHYAPYYLHPEKIYAIRYHPFPGRPSLFHINVSANPWRRAENRKHIGEMLKRYGGGGHKSVGGVEMEGKAATLRGVGKFAALLNTK
jgi:oligoribonuclease NrnB/cAMP/cGMP phosphodiesterase (DHH superfamily)